MPNTIFPVIAGVARAANEETLTILKIIEGNLVGRLFYEKRYLYYKK